MNAFQEVLSSYFEYYLKDLMTAIPAVVVANDRLNESIIAVKPAINERTLDGRVYPWPEVVDVPLVFPCSLTSAVTFPVNVGDTVLLVFSMRGLDGWKAGDGGLANPTDRRSHAIQDAVAIPGLYPIGRSRNNPNARNLPHSTNDLVFSHNIGTGAEAEVRIKPSGQIEVTSPTKLIVMCPETEWTGNISLTGNITHSGNTTQMGDTAQTGNYSINGTFTYNGEEYSLHRHVGVDAGSDTSGPKA